MLNRLFPFILSVCLHPSVVQADAKGPCGSDGPKLCSQVKFGKGSVFQCLQGKKPQLSSSCLIHIESLEEYQLNCKSEIESLCKDKPFYCLLYASAVKALWEQGSKKCLYSVTQKAAYFKKCRSVIDRQCHKDVESVVSTVSCLKKIQGLPEECAEALAK